MQNLLDPAILFFIFGVFAGTLKSNLEIPPAISRFLSLYLLMALGLKGGFALSKSGFTYEVATSLGAAIALAVIVPLISYWMLKRLISKFNAAAIAATYGSVSAVTFVTTVQFLENQGIAYGGHMAAAMALMESPAILMAVLFANHFRQQAQQAYLKPLRTVQTQPAPTGTLRKVLHESFTDGAQLLLLGAMVVGIVTGETGKQAMQPFSGDLFKGMLSFFLLDMGLMAARQFSHMKSHPPILLVYAICAPLVHAGLALTLALGLSLGLGDSILLMVLAASASYIAVPAVLRYAIPEATPSLYIGLSLGVTFPLNIIVGIPFYTWVAKCVLQGG